MVIILLLLDYRYFTSKMWRFQFKVVQDFFHSVSERVSL